MVRFTALMLLFAGAAGYVFAGSSVVPEIDASTAAGAIALLSGATVVLCGRRRTK